MDTYGFIILILFLLLYFITRRKYPFLLFLAGVGAGIVIGAVGCVLITTNLLDSLIP